MSINPLSGIREVVARPPIPYAMDDIDAALLGLLIEDARLSQRQLAAKLGVSAPTVGERMARLERAGVVAGYSAQVNWDALGMSQIVYLSVSTAADSDISQIMVGLWALPEVEAVTLVTGDADLYVRLRVRDYTHLKAVLMDNVWSLAGLQGTTTQMAVAEMPAKPFDRNLLNEVLASRATTHAAPD